MKKIRFIAYSLLLSYSLSACAPVIVIGTGTGMVVSNDRRTMGAFLDDGAIERKANRILGRDKSLSKNTHINITSVNGLVLITGETSRQQQRDQILDAIRNIKGVQRTVNEIRIAAPSSLTARSTDTWLTSKAKTRLIADDRVDSTRIKVVTENKSVYLMGLVTPKEADYAVQAVQRTQGARRIVKLFEYVNR